MLPLEEFCARAAPKTVELLPKSEFEVPGPRFVNRPGILENLSGPVKLSAPSVCAVEISNARIMGSTDVVFVDKEAVHTDLMDPHRDMLHSEVLGVSAFVPPTGKLYVWPPSPWIGQMDEAITLLGECTGNYAHWIFETLPKLVAIDSIAEYRDLPLLVDSWIHPIFYQSLLVMNSNYREIQRVDRWAWWKVRRLVYITPPSFTAPENRAFVREGKRSTPSSHDFTFSQPALRLMRERAVSESKKYIGHGDLSLDPMPNLFRVDGGAVVRAAIHEPKTIRPEDVRMVMPKRVYLKRTAVSAGNPRQLIDSHRVEAILAEYAFVSIDPATLSFAEQVLLLQHAEVVVSVVGAALANLAFAPPGVKVIALSPFYRGANYYYFANMLGALGHDLAFVVGPQADQPAVHIQHRDYHVDLEALRHELERVCAAPC